MNLLSKLEEIEKSFKEIEARMGESDVANDPNQMRSLGRKHSKMAPIVDAFMRYESVIKGIKEAKEMITSAIVGSLFIIFSITILQFIGVSILHIPGFGE